MLGELWSKLRRLVHRQALADNLHAEIDAHLELAIEENLARGMAPAEARAAARRHIGNLTQIEERAAGAWTFARIETLAQDLRYGLRGMRRSPGFALVVVLTLALGIGANTAIFSVVNAVLLRPLPYPAAERLVWLGESDPKVEGISVTRVNFEHWHDENHSFEDMAGYHTAHLTLTGRGEPLLTRAAVVSSGFFGLLGARPVFGRVFTAADDRPGAAPTVVLDYRFWAGRLAADPAIVGATLTLNGKPYEVIGVMAAGFRLFESPIDFYLPLDQFDRPSVDRAHHASTRLLARLKPGVTLTAAVADLDFIMRRLAEADPGPESQHRAHGEYLTDMMTGDVRPTLLILLAAVGLVLIIACANVSSLVLARSTTRAREIAIRSAIGAGRHRLVRQLLTETLLLSAVGGAAGGLLAQWGSRALIALGPRDIPRLAETTFDWRVLLFAAAVTILTGLLTGIAPVFTASRADLVSALKDSSRVGYRPQRPALAQRPGGGGDRPHAGTGLCRRTAVAQSDRGPAQRSGLRSRTRAGARTGAAFHQLPRPASHPGLLRPAAAGSARAARRPGCRAGELPAVRRRLRRLVLFRPGPARAPTRRGALDAVQYRRSGLLRRAAHSRAGRPRVHQSRPAARGHRERDLRAQMVAACLGDRRPRQMGWTIPPRARSTRSWEWWAMWGRWAWVQNPIRSCICLSRSRHRKL